MTDELMAKATAIHKLALVRKQLEAIEYNLVAIQTGRLDLTYGCKLITNLTKTALEIINAD